jgi:hypothetical protein
MSTPRLALVCALGVLLLAPQAASSGGWWSYIDLERSTVAPGQRVEVDEPVAFRSAAAAEEAREGRRFYVYLLRGFDDSVLERAMRKAAPISWWSLGDAEAIRVAELSVSVPDSGLARARATFTVPKLPPAKYHLMLCDAGCAEPLADVVPREGFTVVADPAIAQTAQRVERLERRVRDEAGRFGALRAAAKRARIAARNADSELERLERTLSSVAEEGRRSPRVSRWAYAGWLVAGALAGALVVLVLRRRSRPPAPAPIAAWHPSDEELRELVDSR